MITRQNMAYFLGSQARCHTSLSKRDSYVIGRELGADRQLKLRKGVDTDAKYGKQANQGFLAFPFVNDLLVLLQGCIWRHSYWSVSIHSVFGRRQCVVSWYRKRSE